ncbi:hypothetical protein SD51_09615 [Alicyclobacillus tengchongensis]|nr:hypothetical protein SD51_09615 [Alicyclobacillus tengchongensis]
MKKALHFGAGNIGRGFIGMVLCDNGYHVVFADVVPSLVEQLAAAGSYRVITLDTEIETKEVSGVRAVLLGSEACREELVDADLVTTAVGLGNLVHVADVLADGLQRRMQRNPEPMLNVIACENAIRATSTLRDLVYERVDDEVRTWLDGHVGFPDAAVDRIAPNRDGYAVEPLDAVVERYFEWDIEQPAVRGELALSGATFVRDLGPYLERKLYLVNGAHAAAAYAGYRRGHQTVREAMQDPAIAQLVADVQEEAAQGLTSAYPDLTLTGLRQYANTVRTRFLNPHVVDHVDRVGRDPLRKLAASDRLFGPLRLTMAAGRKAPALTSAIAFALSYDNEQDESAQKVQQMIQEHGVSWAIAQIAGCTDETVVASIVREYERIQGGIWDGTAS